MKEKVARTKKEDRPGNDPLSIQDARRLALARTFAGLGGAVSKFQQPPADGYMSFLVAEAPTRPGEISFEATPVPAALLLFAGGVGLIGLLARRRKQRALTRLQ